MDGLRFEIDADKDAEADTLEQLEAEVKKLPSERKPRRPKS